MTAIPLPNAKVKFWDRNGNPLSGGKLYTWEAGSVVTNKTTWKDANKVTANTNPVILDAFGEADIWLDGNYQINLTNSSDVNQWSAPIDNISSIGGLTEFLYTTTGSPDAYIITPTPAITSYVGLVFSFIASFTNTAPATLNISGVGAVALKKEGATALAASDIVSGRVYQCAFDGTNFQILNIKTNQTITLTGDVTGSGASSFAATISNDAVTFAKMQNINTSKLLGRTTASSGNVEELDFIDDDTMATALSTNIASAESIKAYVDGVVYGAWEIVSTASIAGSTTNIDFLLDEGYDYEVQFSNVYCSATSNEIGVRVSIDGGSTFISTAAAYTYAYSGNAGGGSTDGTYAIATANFLGTTANRFADLTVKILNANNSGAYTGFQSIGVSQNSAPQYNVFNIGAKRNNIEENDAVRFFCTAGATFSGGKYVLRRRRNT
jgi:hypothetical protein